MKGINRAVMNERQQFSKSKKPCVFLSHRSVDKKTVDDIANYIQNAGIDIYLDSLDVQLQIATKQSDAQKMTACIQRGISESTHVLCILSNQTFDDTSWWVPYEIGFSDSVKMNITLFKIKAEREYQIPAYLLIKEVIENISGMNDYLKRLKLLDGTTIIEETFSTDYSSKLQRGIDSILKSSPVSHPLRNVLK